MRTFVAEHYEAAQANLFDQALMNKQGTEAS